MMAVHGATDGAYSDLPDLHEQPQATEKDVTVTLLHNSATQDSRDGITMRLHGQTLHLLTNAEAPAPWVSISLASEDLTVNAVGASTLSLAWDDMHAHISYNDTHKRDFWRYLIDSPASNGPTAPLHAILMQLHDRLHTFDATALGMAAHALYQIEAYLRAREQEDEFVRLDAACATLIKDTILDSIEQAFTCQEQQLDAAGVLAGCRDWLSSQAAVLDRHGLLHQVRSRDPPMHTDAHTVLRAMTAVTCSAMDEQVCATLVTTLPQLLDAIAAEAQETPRTTMLLTRARDASQQLTQLTQHTQPSMFEDLSPSEQAQVRALHYSRVASIVVNVLHLMCSDKASAPPLTPRVASVLEDLASLSAHCRGDVLKQFTHAPEQQLPRFNVRALGGNTSYDKSNELIEKLRTVVDSNPGFLDGAKSSQLLLSEGVARAQEQGADRVNVDVLREEFQAFIFCLSELDTSMYPNAGQWNETLDAGRAAALTFSLGGSVVLLLEKMQEVASDLMSMAEAIIQEQQHLLHLADTKQDVSARNENTSGYGLPGDVLPGCGLQLQGYHVYDDDPSYLADNTSDAGDASSDGSDTHLSDGDPLYDDSGSAATSAASGSADTHSGHHHQHDLDRDDNNDDDDDDDDEEEVFTDPDAHPTVMEKMPVAKPRTESKPTPPPRPSKQSPSSGGSAPKPVSKPQRMRKRLSRARNLTRHRLKRSATTPEVLKEPEELEATDSGPQISAEPEYMLPNPVSSLPPSSAGTAITTTSTAAGSASGPGAATAAGATSTAAGASAAANALPKLSSAGPSTEAQIAPDSAHTPALGGALSRLPSQGGSTASLHRISQVARKAINENSIELMCGVVWLHRLYVAGSGFVTEVVQIMHDLHAIKDEAVRAKHTEALFSLVSILCEEGHLPVDLYRPLIHLLTSPSMAQLLPQASSLLFKVMGDYQRVTAEEKEHARSVQLMHLTENRKRKSRTLQKLKRRSKLDLYADDPYTALRKQHPKKLAHELTAWHNACFRSIPAQEFPLLRACEAPHKTRFRQQAEAVRVWVAQVLAGFCKSTPDKDVPFFVTLAAGLRISGNYSLFEAVQSELLKMEQTDMHVFTKHQDVARSHEANRQSYSRGSSKLTNLTHEYISSNKPCIPTQGFLFDEIEKIAREEAACAVQQNASFKLQRPVDMGRFRRMVTCMETRMDCCRASYNNLCATTAIKEALDIITNESTVVAGTASTR